MLDGKALYGRHETLFGASLEIQAEPGDGRDEETLATEPAAAWMHFSSLGTYNLQSLSVSVVESRPQCPGTQALT